MRAVRLKQASQLYNCGWQEATSLHKFSKPADLIIIIGVFATSSALLPITHIDHC